MRVCRNCEGFGVAHEWGDLLENHCQICGGSGWEPPELLSLRQRLMERGVTIVSDDVRLFAFVDDETLAPKMAVIVRDEHILDLDLGGTK